MSSRRERNPEHERWWVELSHPVYGEVKIVVSWRRVGRGLYECVPLGAEFDLFTPQEHQDAMMADMASYQVRAVLPESTEEAPWT